MVETILAPRIQDPLKNGKCCVRASKAAKGAYTAQTKRGEGKRIGAECIQVDSRRRGGRGWVSGNRPGEGGRGKAWVYLNTTEKREIGKARIKEGAKERRA